MEYDKQWQSMEGRARKKEDEVTDGDGIVTMKTHEEKKFVMEHFACKWAYGYKTW